MECLGSLATELMKCSASNLRPHIDHLVCHKKKIKDLLKKMDELKTQKEDIDLKVDSAKKKGEAIGAVVNKWLSDADIILGKRSDVEASVISSCFKGWCCARHGVGKKADKMIDDVTELLRAAENFSNFSIPVPIQDLKIPAIRDFVAFEATQSAMSKVMNALTNNSSRIGVHGMGGIGKTTLMREICSRVKPNLFDVVVLVVVSQSQDIKKIQSEIADQLTLELKEDSVGVRATRLLNRLKQESRVLIILDDIWSELDFLEVGIPMGDDHKGCKVVLTTRRKEVCNTMNTDEDVELHCLSEVDSWKLFRTNVGQEVDHPNINGLAKDVAKECNGLPVALVTLGRAMHGKKQHEWEDVLHQMSVSDFSLIEGMTKKVFRAIELSYNYIEDETKPLFLFCCLFPEDRKISMDELLRYMIGESKIEETNIDRSKRQLHRKAQYLASSHLLQMGEKSGFVMMHDIIRDVAIIISKRDHGYIVRARRGSEVWPKKEILRECMRLSLMGNEISELPDHPDCSKLLTLALSGCDSLTHIPETFFEGMTSLVNLDLSHTPISSLPSSLACLKNLRTLCLDGCSNLQDASLIGRLTTLEVISLKRSFIKNVPLHEIAKFPNCMFLSESD